MTLKEFREDGIIFADWLPWGGLVRPYLMLNKDRSLMATFMYDELVIVPHEVMLKAVENSSRFFRKLSSGWGVYVEVTQSGEKDLNRMNRYYLTFVYLPDKKNTKDEKEVFDKGLQIIRESFGVLCNARLLEGQEFLDYLRSTICFDRSTSIMPEIPMYLDAFLTQGIEISNVGDRFKVNECSFKVITPMGFVSERVHEVLGAVNEIGIDYRFVVRFLFMGEKEAKKENERYQRTWCQGRRSVLKLLEYPNFDGIFGYYMAAFVLSAKPGEEKELDNNVTIVERTLNDRGIVTVDQEHNFKDVWYGTIPGMVRSNVFAPILPVHDVSSLLVLPKG